MPNWKKVIVSGSNAVLNNITASGHLTVLNGGLTVNTAASTELEVQGNISASGNLFANLSNANGSHNNTVMYDTASGRFYYTGSYGGGGSGDPGDPGSGTDVVANPGSSENGALTTITIDEQNFSIQDTDWFEGTNYLSSSKSVSITGSSNEISTLELKSGNPTVGTNVFRISGENNDELFSVADNLVGTLFTVNDISGLPVFSVEDDGTTTIDGNLAFNNSTGNGIILINNLTELQGLSVNGQSRGEIVKFAGPNETTVAGNLYYWGGSSWIIANNTTTAANGALLAIAIGQAPASDGMLVRGFANVASSVNDGQQVYVSTTNGQVTTESPTTPGQTLRSVGHSVSNGVIYFNPSPDFIILS